MIYLTGNDDAFGKGSNSDSGPYNTNYDSSSETEKSNSKQTKNADKKSSWEKGFDEWDEFDDDEEYWKK